MCTYVYVKITSIAGKRSIKNGLTPVTSVVEIREGGHGAQIENTNENQRFRMSWKIGGIIKHSRCSKQTGPRAGLLLSAFNTATKSQVILPVWAPRRSPANFRPDLRLLTNGEEISLGTSVCTNSQPGVSFEVPDSRSVITLLPCSQTHHGHHILLLHWKYILDSEVGWYISTCQAEPHRQLTANRNCQ